VHEVNRHAEQIEQQRANHIAMRYDGNMSRRMALP
jgi:hypothetical protein